MPDPHTARRAAGEVLAAGVASILHLEIDMQVFRDRHNAGRRLAQRFDRLAGDPGVVVLALPRGGVPVGYEIALQIDAPLDALIVRTLCAPGRTGLAVGALASGGIRAIDPRMVAALDVSRDTLDAVEARERAELERRDGALRSGRSPIALAGRTALLVDDGIASGASMAAAIRAVRSRGPQRVIVAAPVAPPEICEALGDLADEVVCLVTPPRLFSVGAWYRDYAPTSDAEVRDLLEAARDHAARSSGTRRAEPAPTN